VLCMESFASETGAGILPFSVAPIGEGRAAALVLARLRAVFSLEERLVVGASPSATRCQADFVVGSGSGMPMLAGFGTGSVTLESWKTLDVSPAKRACVTSSP